MIQGERVLITGGAGFIGRALVQHLTKRGAKVTIFDNLHRQVHGDGAQPNFPTGVHFIKGDIRDSALVDRLVTSLRPNVIVHLAAETGTGQSYDEPARYCDVNVQGTAHLITAARNQPNGLRLILLASSRAVYGEGPYRQADGNVIVPPPRRSSDLQAKRFVPLDRDKKPLTPMPVQEHVPPSPCSVYASTKLMQEHLLVQCLEGSAVRPVILRLQNVYGPGQSLQNPYTGVLSIFARQILAGETLNIFEDGAITRDFVFVDDVAQAFLSALETELPRGVVLNVGSGVATTILDVARILLRRLGAQESRYRITGQFRPGDVRFALADVSQIQRLTGWTANTPIDQGISKLATWARDRFC
jgi:dTDP-L-rhamnose 4-epimerase